MKTTTATLAAVVAVASTTVAGRPLVLGLDILGLTKVDVCPDLKADVVVPSGINLDTGDCPKKSIPDD